MIFTVMNESPQNAEVKYKVDDNGDYEWVVDPETGEGMCPRKICRLLNSTAQTLTDGEVQRAVENAKEALNHMYRSDTFYGHHADAIETLIRAATAPKNCDALVKALEDIDTDAKKAINGHDALCLLGVIQNRIRETLAAHSA